ncbi:hypothetical protein EZS27_017631 [termite gut metagenome]|uniref:Uncharacterized protein n=1 Tax=termite gut metagenome TaxID=433724 RepID=A0A5J4RK83_9ZZZZ
MVLDNVRFHHANCFIFSNKLIDTLMANHGLPFFSCFACNLFGRPLFFRKFPDDFPLNALGEPTLLSETFFAFIHIHLRHTRGIPPLMTVTLKSLLITDLSFPIIKAISFWVFLACWSKASI